MVTAGSRSARSEGAGERAREVGQTVRPLGLRSGRDTWSQTWNGRISSTANMARR